MNFNLTEGNVPITSSAKKALRQSKTRRVRNIQRKKNFRNYIKDFKKAIEDGKFDVAKELLQKVYKSLDKATKTNTIKKNTASRTKSRLSRKLPGKKT